MNDWVVRLSEVLAQAGVTDARLEAQQIALYAARLGTPAEALAFSLAARRIEGEPLAYLTGQASFMGLSLIAGPGALAPRAETETLAHAALAALGPAGKRAPPRIIDMCCGTGNLACALAHRVTDAQVWACDLTDGCVELARRNVLQLGLQARVHVAQGDLFAALHDQQLEGSIDAIVCNPPYISQGKLDGDSVSLLRHEPREAFDGGPYGLSIHQRVTKDALAFLQPCGVLLFEVGLGQERQVRMLLDRSKAYDDLHTYADGAGNLRAISARKRAK